MKKSIKSITKIALIPILSSALITSTVLLTSCSANNKIVFANFSGYMNPEVQTLISDQYPVQWDEYETNESIPTFLKNGTYDVAVATQYKIVKLARDSYKGLIENKNGYDCLIQPINWSKFNLMDDNNQPLVTQDNETKLYDFSKLKTYFATQTWDMLTAYDLNGDGKIDANCKDNLLNWTIPYFAQTLSFGYRGPEISSLKGDVSFKDIFDYFKTEEAKETLFKGKQTVSLIKDERTNYDLSRLLDNKSIYLNNDPKISSIDNLIKDYNVLDEAMKAAPKQINLEGDSNTILNQLALNQISAAITYNGDLIYASNGGDYFDKLEKENNLPNENNFHVITPKDTLVCFDGIIISNNVDSKLINNVYDVVKKIGIPTDGNKILSDKTIINNMFPLSEETMTSKTINYLPFINFDYVYYNPVWSGIFEAIELPGSNIVEPWQKPFFAKNTIIANTDGSVSQEQDGYYKNIEYPTNSTVSSNLNIANITFINNSVR